MGTVHQLSARGHSVSSGSATLDLHSRVETETASLDSGHQAWLTRRLSQFLPATMRQRFVAEVMGNLGMCESQRERIGCMAGVVIGLPGLAWIMHRESRRPRP